MIIGQSHDQPMGLQKSKATQRVKRLICDALLQGDWMELGDWGKTGLRADPLAADLLVSWWGRRLDLVLFLAEREPAEWIR